MVDVTTWLDERTRGLLDAMFVDDPSLPTEDVVGALVKAREVWQERRAQDSDMSWSEIHPDVLAAISDVSQQAAGDAVRRYVTDLQDFYAPLILADLEQYSDLNHLYAEYSRYVTTISATPKAEASETNGASDSSSSDPLDYRTNSLNHTYNKLRSNPTFGRLTNEQLMAAIANDFDDRHSR
jgi:hypothetical protein